MKAQLFTSGSARLLNAMAVDIACALGVNEGGKLGDSTHRERFKRRSQTTLTYLRHAFVVPRASQIAANNELYKVGERFPTKRRLRFFQIIDSKL